MPGNPRCTVYVGRIVDLFIPKDRETERPKGFAFAEYETEEIADYAVKLFSGLVTLYNRTLKFATHGNGRTRAGVDLSSSFGVTLGAEND